MLEFADLTKIENDKGRFYQLPSGIWVPSVTTVIGYSYKDGISDWKDRVGEKKAKNILDKASTRGTQFHDICEKYLLNSNDIIFPNHLLKDSFIKVKPFLDSIGDIIAIEQTLYSEKIKIAGRTDCIAYLQGKPTIIDFKTSLKAKKSEWIENYFLQCCAYAIMLFEMTGMKVNDFIVAIVSDEMNQPQFFTGKCFDHFTRLIEVRKQFPDWSPHEK